MGYGRDKYLDEANNQYQPQQGHLLSRLSFRLWPFVISAPESSTKALLNRYTTATPGLPLTSH
jgi:hypothetical protein